MMNDDESDDDVSAMKLGVGYNVWDCEELLWRSVACMREHAHFVVVR
jgi:hypothetical protein